MKKYLKEYKEMNLKRIPLEVSHDFYIKILQQAALNNKSVNGYIKSVLEREIGKDEYSDKKVERVREILKSMGEQSRSNE